MAKDSSCLLERVETDVYEGCKGTRALTGQRMGGERWGTDTGLVDGDVSEKIPPERVNFFLE